MRKSGLVIKISDIIEKDNSSPAPVMFPMSEMPTVAMPALVRHDKWRRVAQESMIVGFFLIVAFLVRFYAALHTGLEVDEPIYRNAAASLLQYGSPGIRPTFLHQFVPFLYHPPFFFYELAGWFYLWGSTSYFTGRMFSVTTSLMAFLLLYLFVRWVYSPKKALLILVLVISDPWLIFTNQAIYIENSLLLLVIPSIWAYWHATAFVSSRARTLGWYTLTGLFVGCAIIYKQIGSFLLVVIVLHLLLRRKHWLGHAVLAVMVALVVASYILGMHLMFGAQFDQATLDQVRRTLGHKAAPGLNADPLTILGVIWERYWIFSVTIVVLLGGAAVTLIRYLQAVLRRRNISQPVLICWALGGVLFALGISLKNPHYMILWIMPLYVVIAQEMVELFWNRPLQLHGIRISRRILVLVLGFVMCVLLVGENTIGYQGRFTNLPDDPLQEAAAYVNENVPPTAIVLTKNYIGVDLVPPFLDIDLINTPKEIFRREISYMVLYSSVTAPLPSSLGPVAYYCVPMKQFSGFKDHIQVCKIDPAALANLGPFQKELKPRQ